MLIILYITIFINNAKIILRLLKPIAVNMYFFIILFFEIISIFINNSISPKLNIIKSFLFFKKKLYKIYFIYK